VSPLFAKIVLKMSIISISMTVLPSNTLLIKVHQIICHIYYVRVRFFVTLIPSNFQVTSYHSCLLISILVKVEALQTTFMALYEFFKTCKGLQNKLKHKVAASTKR
jgi:hypothetical protein